MGQNAVNCPVFQIEKTGSSGPYLLPPATEHVRDTARMLNERQSRIGIASHVPPEPVMWEIVVTTTLAS
jgi:hypothetical protein